MEPSLWPRVRTKNYLPASAPFIHYSPIPSLSSSPPPLLPSSPSHLYTILYLTSLPTFLPVSFTTPPPPPHLILHSSLPPFFINPILYHNFSFLSLHLLLSSYHHPFHFSSPPSPFHPPVLNLSSYSLTLPLLSLTPLLQPSTYSPPFFLILILFPNTSTSIEFNKCCSPNVRQVLHHTVMYHHYFYNV